MLDREASN
jgi:hypothetical protein